MCSNPKTDPPPSRPPAAARAPRGRAQRRLWRAGLLAATLFGAGPIADAGAEPGQRSVPRPRDWQLIVIHHSATPTGSAATFDASHRARGMINGLAYHFVIDNGSEDTEDGFIETGARWVRQMPGGHCRQADVNQRGIGICLVGDFTHKQPTENQMRSLALLIRGLQHQFGIADENVIGHGDIIGEFSECPGKSFPWADLKRRLKEKQP
jgi:N-acetyl-anhydromuramyl-L-alanine amidase AmpD